MPTSSITDPIEINNPKFLEDYVAHMEESAKNFHPRTEDEMSGVCEDEKVIHDIMEKALAKKVPASNIKESTSETKDNSTTKKCEINIVWNSNNRVWTAVSADVPGLFIELGSYDAIIERLRHVIPELCEKNGEKYDKYEITYVCFRLDTLTEDVQ